MALPLPAFLVSVQGTDFGHPAGQVLLSGVEMGCTEEAMMVVAMTSTDPVLLNTRCWFALSLPALGGRMLTQRGRQ